MENVDTNHPGEKFIVSDDLGIIIVPDDYVHKNALNSMDKDEELYYFNENITQQNFGNPSRVLKPGDRLWVRIFKHVSPGTITSKEQMEFLLRQNAIFTGAHGALLVYKQKLSKIPKQQTVSSFDYESFLWKDTFGDRRVPFLEIIKSGDLFFKLGYYGYWCNSGSSFFCFCEAPVGG